MVAEVELTEFDSEQLRCVGLVVSNQDGSQYQILPLGAVA